MEKYKAIYKCRLCGKVYHNGAETGEGGAMCNLAMIATGVKITEPLAPQPYEIHRCHSPRAGSLGLADFQGWDKEGEA